MQVREVVAALGLTPLAGQSGLDREVTGGYAADLLSCAMAGAQAGNLWITLQGHLNVVAVAELNDLAGIIVAEGKPVAGDALMKADDEGIPVLSSPLGTYAVAGRLWEIGIR
jgi:predicted transcriptional regulator